MRRCRLLNLALFTVAAASFHILTTLSTSAQSTPKDWKLVTKAARFGIRDTAQTFTFRDKMWLSNGYLTNEKAYRELWSTKNGREWILEVAHTPYDTYSAMAVLGGTIYAVKNTAWSSRDGIKWQKLTDNGPSQDRDALPVMQSFAGKLWYFTHEGVRSSTDGVNWEKQPEPPYGFLSSFSVSVFKGALWVVGGGIFNETSDPPGKQYPKRRAVNAVWRSVDGSNWEKMPDAPWEARMWPSTVVHKGKIYVVGGYSNIRNENFNDVWETSDGISWSKVETSTTFSPRHWVSLWSRRDSIFMAAGNAWPLMNDVWNLK